jgi:hypothetical protein
MARALGDPAVLLRTYTTLLAIDGDDELLEETRSVARRISAELPDEEMRRLFLNAEPVRNLGNLDSKRECQI